MTGIPEGTLRYWAHCDDGRGPISFKMGRRRVWERTDVENWIEARKSE
jgi:prophage regulatory protein